MKHSEKTEHIAPAFVTICGALANPERNRTVTIRPRSGQAYEFSYATLDSILDLLRPVLFENKCALTQVIAKNEEGVQVLESRIMHESGEWMSSEFELVLKSDSPQSVASTMTYFRRYAICALFPIAGTEDEAGTGIEGGSISEGASTKGIMSGAELSTKFVEEFWNRDSFTIAVREGNIDQWRGWLESLLKKADAATSIYQVWNDNEATIASLAPPAFNRLQKIRNAQFERLGMEVPSEYSDDEKPDGPPEAAG